MTRTKVINKTNRNIRVRWLPSEDTITVEIYPDINLTGYYSTQLVKPKDWVQIEGP